MTPRTRRRALENDERDPPLFMRFRASVARTAPSTRDGRPSLQSPAERLRTEPRCFLIRRRRSRR